MEVIKLSEVQEFQEERYLSKLVHDSEKVRVALFCLESGQEVVPHTSTSEVVFCVVEGQGEVVVGEEAQKVGAGNLVVCPPNVSHGLKAEERFVVLAFIAPRP